VTRRMGQKKLALRSKVKPFIKVRWTLGLLAVSMSEILII
jgi:hypothetical protein